MNADVKGALAQINDSWKAFVHNGKPMTKAEVKAVLEYAMTKGYETTAELNDAEVNNILSQMKINPKYNPITKSALRWWLGKTVSDADKWSMQFYHIESNKATREQIVEMYQSHLESKANQTTDAIL